MKDHFKSLNEEIGQLSKVKGLLDELLCHLEVESQLFFDVGGKGNVYTDELTAELAQFNEMVGYDVWQLAKRVQLPSCFGGWSNT